MGTVLIVYLGKINYITFNLSIILLKNFRDVNYEDLGAGFINYPFQDERTFK